MRCLWGCLYFEALNSTKKTHPFEPPKQIADVIIDVDLRRVQFGNRKNHLLESLRIFFGMSCAREKGPHQKQGEAPRRWSESEKKTFPYRLHKRGRRGLFQKVPKKRSIELKKKIVFHTAAWHGLHTKRCRGI